MPSIFDNGGYVGVPAYLDDDLTQHVIGLTPNAATLTYVGGRTQQSAGTASDIPVSLTGLTGGVGTAPIAGDLVIIAIEVAGSADKPYRIANYTQIADLYANSTNDSNFQVGYKFMQFVVDTSATITGGSGAGTDAAAIVVQVWRNVDPTTPIDVTPTTNTQTTTNLPDPPAITPVTTGARIIVAAGTAHTGGTDTFGAAYLSNFLTVGGNGSTHDSTVGMGWVAWPGGAYNPAAWTHTQGTSTNFSSNSVTFALRPGPLPTFGNFKNSGIWSMGAVYDTWYLPGQQLFTTTTTWVVPENVTRVSAAVIGGGGGGSGGDSGRNESNTGGGGGALGWATFRVTPGETLTITVGAGGTSITGENGTAGGASAIQRGTTDIIRATGGGGGLERSNTPGAGGTYSVGTVLTSGGGNGGSGGVGTGAAGGSGGGGAGGYSGNGGAGGNDANGAGTAGLGGAAGGGSGRSGTTGIAGGGGGVGVLGEGTNGAGGTASNGGGGGSGGGNGLTNVASPTVGGGLYGGGGGARTDQSGTGAAGAAGAVRIIWGKGRTYPSTNTGNV